MFNTLWDSSTEIYSNEAWITICLGFRKLMLTRVPITIVSNVDKRRISVKPYTLYDVRELHKQGHSLSHSCVFFDIRVMICLSFHNMLTTNDKRFFYEVPLHTNRCI